MKSVIEALQRAQLALLASHNLTVTDRPELPREQWPTWVADHSAEIAALDEAETLLRREGELKPFTDWLRRCAEAEQERARLDGAAYQTPDVSNEEVDLVALDLLRQFDGLPFLVVKRVLRRAEFWLDATQTLDCRATEFQRAVAALQAASGDQVQQDE